MPDDMSRQVLSWHVDALEVLAKRALETLGGLTSCLQAQGNVQLEVLVSDERKRRSLELAIRRTLRRLDRALGSPFPDRHLVVIVQEVIRTNRERARCYQLGERPDGTRTLLVRLALRLDGRGLGQDEVLSALAEEWIGLWSERSLKRSILIPLDPDTPQGSYPPPQVGTLDHRSNGTRPDNPQP